MQLVIKINNNNLPIYTLCKLFVCLKWKHEKLNIWIYKRMENATQDYMIMIDSFSQMKCPNILKIMKS